MIKAIVFDFYGVIIPEVYWAWLEKTVKDLDKKEDYFFNLANDMDKGKKNPDQALEELEIATGVPKDQISPQMDKETVINKPLLNLINELKKKYKIGLLSNSDAGWLDLILIKHNLKEYFDEIVSSSAVGFIKPQPEIFQIMLDRLKVKPTEIIFIDDRLKNIEAAKALGIDAILYENVEGLKKQFKKRQVDF